MKLQRNWVVLVKKMSVFINFLLLNINLVSVLNKICPHFDGHVWQDWQTSWTLVKGNKWTLINILCSLFSNVQDELINIEKERLKVDKQRLSIERQRFEVEKQRLEETKKLIEQCTCMNRDAIGVLVQKNF